MNVAATINLGSDDNEVDREYEADNLDAVRRRIIADYPEATSAVLTVTITPADRLPWPGGREHMKPAEYAALEAEAEAVDWQP
jgi:hypothetical protein